MNSAIEVLESNLKQVKKAYKNFGDYSSAGIEIDKNLINALNEAIVALEQKEKLVKWLDDKEIKLKDIKEKGWSLEQLAGKQILINEIRKELEEEGVEK